MTDQGGCDLTIHRREAMTARTREYNEYMAKPVSIRGASMFTSLPFPDIDASLKELAYG